MNMQMHQGARGGTTGDQQDVRTASEGGGTHTPGPWAIEPVEPGVSDELAIVAPRDRFQLASVWGGIGMATELTMHANARLMAAAPELLDAVHAGGEYSNALKRYQDDGVRGEIIPPTEDLERLFLAWHDKAHAAIAKVEGR